MTHMQIDTLPLTEKIELMESLWDSICHEPEVSSAIPDWHKEVLADRMARLDSGNEPVSSWEEAKVRIRDQAGKL
jgi:putative addiction module component (TIGR02574 family)